MSVDFIYWCNRPFAVPEGYCKVLWADVKIGDEVYICGTNAGEPWAYGPYQVYNPDKHELINSKGVVFLETGVDGVLKKL